jgi:hypothetical protein
MNFSKIASMASTLALAMSMGAASAQSTGSSGSSAGSGDASGGQGGGNTASSMTFQKWLDQRSGARISRQAYLDEVGRRWDAMDRTRVGLTADEINRLYWTSAVGMGGPPATTQQD